jgi:hypothetical protein
VRRADVEPGRFYRVRYQRVGGEVPTGLVRVERIAEPRFPGDDRIVVATTFQVRGPVETRHALRQVMRQEDPDERTARIIAVIEQQGPETLDIDAEVARASQAEYDRLVGLGWSRRDAARYCRDFEREERARLVARERDAEEEAQGWDNHLRQS